MVNPYKTVSLCLCDQHSCLLILLFHWFYVHYFLPFFHDYCPVLSTVLSVFVLGCLWMAHCLCYYYYCLCLVVSEAVIKCPNGSVIVCFCSWSLRYCSAENCVGFTCCLFCVTKQPVCDANVKGPVKMILITFSFCSAMGPWSSHLPFEPLQ